MVYAEALNVGYRQFITHRTPTLFPFGHGQSYAAFAYSRLALSTRSMSSTDTLHLTVDVTNTGECAAREVAQVYVRDVSCSVHRPDRELRAFCKTRELPPGGTETLSFELSPRAFAFYDVSRADWYVESGVFEILAAASAEDIRLIDTVTVTNPEVREVARDSPKGYLTLDSDGLAALGLTVPSPDERLPYGINSTIQEIVEMNCLVHGGYNLVLGAIEQLVRRTSLARDAIVGLGDVEVWLLVARIGTHTHPVA